MCILGVSKYTKIYVRTNIWYKLRTYGNAREAWRTKLVVVLNRKKSNRLWLYIVAFSSPAQLMMWQQHAQINALVIFRKRTHYLIVSTNSCMSLYTEILPYCGVHTAASIVSSTGAEVMHATPTTTTTTTDVLLTLYAINHFLELWSGLRTWKQCC